MMKKHILYTIIVTLIFSFLALTKEENKSIYTVTYNEDTVSTVLAFEHSEQEEISQIPFAGNSFVGFKEAVAFKESQGRYSVVNRLGYLGKYQFGKSTLKRFKIYDTHKFLNTPELQEDAFIALCSLNKWILRRDIKRSVGRRMNGVKITESGILAAAHLAGAGNVKKFLRTGGNYAFEDANGTTIKHYMKKFSGYNTSNIRAIKKPVIGEMI